MNRLSLDNVVPYGTAAARIFKNMARMHDRFYQPGIVGTSEAENVGWPGDWEGRIVLALTLLARALKTEPAYLDDIVAVIDRNCNEKGYRGPLSDIDAVNEQQLSGHGWLLRGLVEYYRLRGTPEVRARIEAIAKELFLPLRGRFGAYPRRPEDRVYQGEAAGELAGIVVAGWKVSSDTGCAFISLDGLTQAYELMELPGLGELIREMIGVFKNIDFTGITMQTHATLTATRGVMRMYRLTGEAEYLDIARRIFRMYWYEGMTENYANFNWFCRPSWTEPCGIIDSFMLAFDLWEATGEAGFLDDAHHIWYNGVCRGQRPNGGFGLDDCVEDGFVRVQTYEAYWCCSMRGGEGVTAASQFGIYSEPGRLVFPFYSDGLYTPEPGLALRMRSCYPFAGYITVEVTNGDGREREWAFFLPSWVSDAKVTYNGHEIAYDSRKGFASFSRAVCSGDKIEVSFAIPLFTVPAISSLHRGSGYHSIRYGTYILGARQKDGKPPECLDINALANTGDGIYKAGDLTLAPLDQAFMLAPDELMQAEYRILFKQ